MYKNTSKGAHEEAESTNDGASGMGVGIEGVIHALLCPLLFFF